MPWMLERFGFLARAAMAVAICAQAGALAQQGPVPDAPLPARPAKPFQLPEQLPEKATLAPSVTIPVGPLGFTAPAAFYLGERSSMASLDFLDENHLLFSFRVPGLIKRQAGATGPASAEERQIRALVLALPGGTVEAEAVWTVHDRARYLWPAGNGRFLFRDHEALLEGGASLELKPYLRLPGPVLWLDMDPSGQYLVTDSRETEKSRDAAASPQAGVEIEAEGQNPAAAPEVRVRIVRRDTGKVMLTSHARTTVRLPINGEGYLEALRVSNGQWMAVLSRFTGGTAVMGRVDSACTPLFDFLATEVALVTGCTASGEAILTALTTGGRRLWQAEGSERSIWPLVMHSADGRRMVRETLVVSHGVNAHAPMDTSDIKGQLVLAMNTVDGQTVLAAPATPVLDGGGNAALSPSGRRAAVLHGGALEVYELPPAPDLPGQFPSR